MHGGAAPQVRAKAEERIAAAADPAAAKLVQLIKDARVPYAVQLSAARDLLDRAGIGKERPIQIEVKAWQYDLGSLIVDLPATADDVVDAEIIDEPPALTARRHP